MDERIAGQHTLLSFYRRYVIAETLTIFGRFEHKIVSVSAITYHQYKESRVCCPAILSSICLGGDLGMLLSLNREAKQLFC